MFLRGLKEKRERILALDLLRGTFLIVIFINHIAWSPTLFDFITGRSHLFASAAEGFFAISGILVGYIYGPRVLKKTKSTVQQLVRRAGWLYLLSISFTTLYTILTLFLPPETIRSQYLHADIWQFLYQTLTLQFTYGWADFLSRYAVLMAFAPLAIWLIAKGRAWLVAALSVAIWVLWRDSTFSHFTAWQIVFFIGMIIGYYLPVIETWFTTHLSQNKRRILAGSIMTLSLVTFVANIILAVLFPILAGEFKSLFSPASYQVLLQAIDLRTLADTTLFNRESLEIGRLLIGTLWFSALYLLYRRYEQAIDTFTRGSLQLLGQNSLYVYGLQSFILFMMDIFLDPPDGASFLLKTLIAANAVYLVYLLTKRRATFANVRRRLIQRRMES